MYNKLKGIYELILIGIGLAIILVFIYIHRKTNNARSSRMACRTFFTLAGIRLEQVGDFDESADLIIMNHQSVADILCLEGYHPRNICWIAKKQLGEMPFYGYALTGPEMILIDREDKKGFAILLKTIKEKLAQNRPIVIFPEGTRSRGKEKLLPFKQGAKFIAEKFNLKIQPIVLINTRRIFNTSPLEATSNRARMVLLESFCAGEIPKDKVFYKPSSETETAVAQGKKFGLIPLVEPKDSMLDSIPSIPSTIANDQESINNQEDKDWYKALEECMRDVYLRHYKALNPKES